MCPRSKAIIPGMLRKAEKLEAELAQKKKKERIYVLHDVPNDVFDMVFLQVNN